MSTREFWSIRKLRSKVWPIRKLPARVLSSSYRWLFSAKHRQLRSSCCQVTLNIHSLLIWYTNEYTTTKKHKENEFFDFSRGGGRGRKTDRLNKNKKCCCREKKKKGRTHQNACCMEYCCTAVQKCNTPHAHFGRNDSTRSQLSEQTKNRREHGFPWSSMVPTRSRRLHI